jgi:hypothetical protein
LEIRLQIHHIPSLQRHPEVHNQLHALLTKRMHTEIALETLLTDEHPDGTSKDRKESQVDRKYNHLSAYHNFLNRSMLTIYAEYLIKPANPPPRQLVQSCKTQSPASPTPGSSQAASEPKSVATPCPEIISGVHLPNKRPTRVTRPIPKFDPNAPPTQSQLKTSQTSAPDTVFTALHTFLHVDDTVYIMARNCPTTAPTPEAGWLVVDTGASHVLLRASDSHILTHTQMTLPHQRPFAILIAANGAKLHAIGRGLLTVNTVTVAAYIFKDSELAHNLLGIAPFADQGCIAIFAAKTFELQHHSSLTTVMKGQRHHNNLWRIPMPTQSAPTTQLPQTFFKRSLKDSLMAHANTLALQHD